MSPYTITRNAKLTQKLEEHFPEVNVHNLSKEERNQLALQISNKERAEKKQRQKFYSAF